MPKKKLWIISGSIIMICLAGLSMFLGRFFINRNQTTVGEPQMEIDTDEFIGMIFKIPGSERNGYWELHVSKLESRAETGKMNVIKGEYILNKKPKYQISSKSGMVYWNTKALRFSGQVKLNTIDGKELTAEEMFFDPDNKNIIAKKQVILKTPELTLSTEQINSNSNLEKATFTGVTKVTYQR